MNSSDTDSLSYSNSAICVKHEFYDKRVMLYVEGDDDVPFWDERFRRIVPSDFYKIEQVHGKMNLVSYIEGILNGEITNAVVACDADYSLFSNSTTPQHSCIITTFGHSIENTMFCPMSTAIYLRKMSKTGKDYLQDVNNWFSTFCQLAKELLPYEIANSLQVSSEGELPIVFNKNVYYFISQKDKKTLSKRKIQEYVSQIEKNYNRRDIEKIQEKLNNLKMDIRYLIQGHFLANGVMNYIRQTIKDIRDKNVAISDETIYESFSYCKCDCKPICDDKIHTDSQIRKVYDYFKL